MTATVTSPSGRVLHHRATRTTTPREDAEAKAVRIKISKEQRLAENKEYLKNANVQAFLKAISEAEGGGYDFKYGAAKGKRNDPWRFTDFSTHPGAGFDGVTTAAGMYQINKVTWKDHGEGRMGLTDFTPETQDLIAVSILRGLGVIDKIKEGDIESGLSAASKPWAKAAIAIAVLIGFSSLAYAKSFALHTGELFTTARAKLYDDGWRADPAAHAATGEYDGVDRLLVQAGYSEVDYCSLGKTFCVLQYTRGNACLRLHTQGEEIRLMKVERWTSDCREKRPSDGRNILPADVRYMAQWRNDCEDLKQCKGADALLRRLNRKYAKNPSIMKILRTYSSPAEIYPNPQK